MKLLQFLQNHIKPPQLLSIHPTFWPGILHEEGDFGFNFNFSQPLHDSNTGSGQSEPVPWETEQLNVTQGYTFDYTYISPDDPPTFVPFSFELYDWRWWCTFATLTWYLPFVVGIVYLSVIFGLEKFMRKREAWNLKWPLFVWNASLGIFSVVGLLRTFPEFASILGGNKGLYKAICYRDGGNYPMAYWSLLFVLSKYAELGDTVFIILRKRPLVFIQWYHHFITMVMCWLTAPYIEPISRWYVVMNYAVHSMMYPYFALSAIGIKLPRKVSITITTCQLTQMLIGLLVNFLSAFLIRMGIPCYRHPFSIKISLLVYGSFTVLFTKLFYDVITNSKRKKTKKTD